MYASKIRTKIAFFGILSKNMVKCNFHRSTVIKSFFSAESTWPGMTLNDLNNAKSTSIQIRSTITFVDKKVTILKF